MYCVCILTFTVPISLVWRAAKKKKKKIIISVCLINGCICMYVCMYACMYACNSSPRKGSEILSRTCMAR